MKVVINSCYGGYSISALAIKRLAELNNKPCFFFKTEFNNNKSYHIPCSIEECKKSLFFSAYTVPNPDEYTASAKDWHEMSDEEKTEHNRRYDEISLDIRPSDRTDPLLIKVIEELGEDANGSCAKLTIVEIPDGIDYEIDEYDGIEHIAEKHRTWS